MSDLQMFLRLFLSCFLLVLLPQLSFANSCEKRFANKEVFIAFVKKQLKESGKSFETLLDPEWVANITKNTKHWTHVEASQYLNFLINRIGEKAALQRLEFSPDFPKMRVSDFIKKVAAYDQINKEIITAVLKARIPISLFLQEKSIQKVKKTFPLIESYIGTEGAIYLISHHTMFTLFFKSKPYVIRKIIDFVDDYTQKHASVTDTLNNRADYFRQFVSLPYSQARISNIKLNNVSELKEFSKLIYEKLRELDKEIGERELDSTTFNIMTNRMNLNLIQSSKIASMFTAYSTANIKNLKETVAILEQYIKPEEVAHMMLNSTAIYSVKPQKLKEVIDILKKAHSVTPPENIHAVKERMLKEIEEKRKEIENIDPDLVQPTIKAIENMSEPPLKPEQFISYMIREHKDFLLSANPTHIKDVMAILEKDYIHKDKWRFVLQPNKQKEIHAGLLFANPIHLQKVLNVLEKYLEKDDIFLLITEQFINISAINRDTLDSFIKVVDILGTHIEVKEVLNQRISELLADSYLTPEIYNTLTTISSTSNHNSMKQFLTELPILEFAPSVQEMRNSMSENPSEPTTLH